METDIPVSAFRNKLKGFMGHPPLKTKLILQRDLIFAVAACNTFIYLSL